MRDLAFFNGDERTEYSDELYSLIGRALTIATHYEQNCKALAYMLNIRDNAHLMDDKEQFEKLLKKLLKWQLKQSIDKFTSAIREGDLSIEVAEALENTIFRFLHEGREARNTIVHELASGISKQIGDDDFRGPFLEMTKGLVAKVAKADFFIVGFIETQINEVDIAPSLDSYVTRVVNWVCNVEI
jgi:hypothetical protein